MAESHIGDWIPVELVVRVLHRDVWGSVTYNGMVGRSTARASCGCGQVFQYDPDAMMLHERPDVARHEQSLAVHDPQEPSVSGLRRIRAELGLRLTNPHTCHATLERLCELVRELDADDAERCLVAFEHVLIACDGVQPFSALEHCAGQLARACNHVLER